MPRALGHRVPPLCQPQGDDAPLPASRPHRKRRPARAALRQDVLPAQHPAEPRDATARLRVPRALRWRPAGRSPMASREGADRVLSERPCWRPIAKPAMGRADARMGCAGGARGRRPRTPREVCGGGPHQNRVALPHCPCLLLALLASASLRYSLRRPLDHMLSTARMAAPGQQAAHTALSARLPICTTCLPFASPTIRHSLRWRSGRGRCGRPPSGTPT